MGQSSNDVFPTAVAHRRRRGGRARSLSRRCARSRRALAGKAEAFDHIVKLGRTHLMDAVPIRLGQEFSGYAADADQHPPRRGDARRAGRELALGGTAVGTGLGADPDFAPQRDRDHRAARSAIPLRQAPNLFEALAARDAPGRGVGRAARRGGVSLTKIANDIRWLGSGPRCGIGEIQLPELQPGSSIMPGKVNPVMAEMLLMVCAQVIGNDATDRVGRRGRQLRAQRDDPRSWRTTSCSRCRSWPTAAACSPPRCVEGIEPERGALQRRSSSRASRW